MMAELGLKDGGTFSEKYLEPALAAGGLSGHYRARPTARRRNIDWPPRDNAKHRPCHNQMQLPTLPNRGLIHECLAA
jgi:hypothetical protein